MICGLDWCRDDCRHPACGAADYWTLTKPEVNLLIGVTTAAGFCAGWRGAWRGCVNHRARSHRRRDIAGRQRHRDAEPAAGASIRCPDASHSRPAGCRRPDRPWHALVFGVVLATAGTLELAVAVNRLSSVLALATMASYLLVYTPLKRKTPLCTLIGAHPRGRAAVDWMGGGDGSSERRGVDPGTDGLLVAISTFHGDCLDVPRGLPPRGI